jgi:hypothetical protein
MNLQQAVKHKKYSEIMYTVKQYFLQLIILYEISAVAHKYRASRVNSFSTDHKKKTIS